MRVGIIELASHYWPEAFAQRAAQIAGVELRAAANIGRSPAEVSATLGIDAMPFAVRHGVRLFHDPAEMIAEERLKAVFVCAESTRQADYVEVACRTGVDLYIAKPMATTLA